MGKISGKQQKLTSFFWFSCSPIQSECCVITTRGVQKDKSLNRKIYFSFQWHLAEGLDEDISKLIGSKAWGILPVFWQQIWYNHCKVIMGSRLDFLNLIYGLFCDCFVSHFVSHFVSVSLPELVLLQSFLRSFVITVCFLPTLKIVFLKNSFRFPSTQKTHFPSKEQQNRKRMTKMPEGKFYHGMMIDFFTR